MPCVRDRLSYVAWNVGYKPQKNHKGKILSSGWVLDIRKWFGMLGVEDLLELPSDAMQDAIIEERLIESLRMTWEDVKRSKLEYYIANINPKCWIKYNIKLLINLSHIS